RRETPERTAQTSGCVGREVVAGVVLEVHGLLLGGRGELDLGDVDRATRRGVVVHGGLGGLHLVGGRLTERRPLGGGQRGTALRRLPHLLPRVGIDDPLALRPLLTAVGLLVGEL